MTLPQILALATVAGGLLAAVWWWKRPADRSLPTVAALALLAAILLLYLVGVLFSPPTG